MAKGFKHGGSVAPVLNFKVVGGTEIFTAPGENTIWVNTDTGITGWVLSPAKPEEPVEGMVWISVGTASDVTFNALKKNGIMVYLISASQYVDGAWEPKAAQIYQNGGWSSFSYETLFLYQPGDVCEIVTGGYMAAAMKAGSLTSGQSAPSVTYGDSSMVILPKKSSALANYVGGIVRTNSKIDCAQYNTLIFDGDVEGLGVGSGKLAIWSEMGSVQSENLVKRASLVNGSDPVVIDVSDLDGSYYIGFGFDSVNVQIMVTVTSLRLEG